MILEMFHVKHFCPINAQNLTSPKKAASLGSRKIAQFLVRPESRGGGASMAWFVVG
jgi:hypothetical protein